MRTEAKARRSGLDPLAAAQGLMDRLLPAIAWPPGAVVAGTWPLGQEIDLRPLLLALHRAGHPIVLPHTPRLGLNLVFRLWEPGRTPMVAERFGTMRPDGPEAVPDIVLVPLLAFDRAGSRLGYGGGYYDRTLASLPGALAIGAAFAAQEVPEVPSEPHDRRLDLIATEAELLDFRRMDRTGANTTP